MSLDNDVQKDAPKTGVDSATVYQVGGGANENNHRVQELDCIVAGFSCGLICISLRSSGNFERDSVTVFQEESSAGNHANIANYVFHLGLQNCQMHLPINDWSAMKNRPPPNLRRTEHYGNATVRGACDNESLEQVAAPYEIRWRRFMKMCGGGLRDWVAAVGENRWRRW
jgi:hypothetical protein